MIWHIDPEAGFHSSMLLPAPWEQFFVDKFTLLQLENLYMQQTTFQPIDISPPQREVAVLNETFKTHRLCFQNNNIANGCTVHPSKKY